MRIRDWSADCCSSESGGDKPFIAGSVMVDQTVLSYKGKRRDALVGTLSSGWTADALDTPEWNRFKSDYRASFEDAFPAPSFFAFSYYSNVKAMLQALDKVHGDLSNGQAKFREALQNLQLEIGRAHV